MLRQFAEERTFASHTSQLHNVNLLYLGLSVHILCDASYISRFWTCMEAWLSMQMPSNDGLLPVTDPSKLRCTITCILNAKSSPEMYKQALIDTWSKKTCYDVYDNLARPDVVVTNTKDKAIQASRVWGLVASSGCLCCAL